MNDDCRFDLLTRGQLQRPGPASGELDGMTNRLQARGQFWPVAQSVALRSGRVFGAYSSNEDHANTGARPVPFQRLWSPEPLRRSPARLRHKSGYIIANGNTLLVNMSSFLLHLCHLL